MVETLAKNEQHPCEKLDALKDAIQHRHRAYDSLYKAISGKG
jgi:chaperonin cofactor prefoldin